jgi:4-aminobutyrate aminotransferase-like enzyme
VIRFLPPLEITADEVDQVVAALNAVLRERLDDDRSAEEDA